MAKINDLPLLSNPTSDMYCLVGKSDLNKVPWSAIQAQIGSPYIATTAAGMTDKTRVYVYQGSELGYTSGNWYYWNGSAWTSGGVYNSAGISTDTSLTASGQAADAKTVGDKLSAVNTKIDGLSVETDSTLTKTGKPADAKSTGDRLKKLEEATVEVDTTLEVSGMAADAKAVGQQIDNVKKDIENYKIKEDSVQTDNIKDGAVTRDKLASDVFENTNLVEDRNGRNFKIIVNDDGSLGLEEVFQLFTGKKMVSRIAIQEYTKTDNNRYYWVDKVTGEKSYSGPSGWYPLKSFDNEGQASTFKTTKAYDTLLKNISGEYTFILNAITYSLGQEIGLVPVRDNWKNNVSMTLQGVDKNNLYPNITIDSMPYLDANGEIKTFSVAKHAATIKESTTYGTTNGWASGVAAAVLTKDGKIKIYYNGTFIEENSAPSDFAKWDFSFYATQTSVSAGILATARITADNGRELIILNNAVTEKDLISYYNYYAGSDTALTTQDSICMQIGDTTSVWYGVVPETSKNLVTLSTNDTEIVSLKDNVLTALKEGTATITVNVNNASKDITIYVGKEVTDTDREAIETLSTRDINQIILVNEGDVPSTLAVDDEYALYALGIDTTESIPYKYSDQNMLKFSSSDNSICDVSFGVLHAKKKGKVTITISSTDETVKKTLNITVVDKDNDLAEYDIYKCDDRKHGIYNNGTNAESTTKGLKAAMDYAVEQGYKGIRFNKGKYLLDRKNAPVLIPSNLEVDFNNSELYMPDESPLSTGYKIFSCDSVENVTVKNGTFYGENIYNHHYHVEPVVMFTVKDRCKNIRIENCEFSYSPGFNLTLSYIPDYPVIPFKLENVEQGNISDNGTTNDTNTTNHFRSKDFIDISTLKTDEFGLGNMQGYQGYSYMTSRLYNVYFYDENKTFISALKWCVQYQTYTKPSNAKYCKVMFFQENAPTNKDPDYGGIAHFYCLKNPENVYIKNCTFRQNVSTGLSPQGGKHLVVSDCIFDTNGHADPSAQIDWEDGRLHMQGHIIRRCDFTNSSGYVCQIVATACRDITFHDNYVQKSPYSFGTEALNTRTYRNMFKDAKVNYTNKGDCAFIGNTYTLEPTIGTPQGGTVIQAGNKKIDN